MKSNKFLYILVTVNSAGALLISNASGTGTQTTTSCGGAHVHALRMAGNNVLHRSERKNCEVRNMLR